MDGAGPEPLVSVVVPTYGRDHAHLRTAVESVDAQTYRPLELVVVDDSKADVRSTVTGATDVPTRIRRGGDHGGAGAARNTGIGAAEGSYIAFLDDDDMWEPEKLERQVAATETDPEIGLVVTGQRYVRDGERIGRRFPDVDGDVTQALLRGARLCPFSAAMVRASAVRQAGLVDESLPIWEDLEWYVRLSQHCRVATIDAPLVTRRMGDHKQLTDDFEQLRDHAYPRMRDKHRSLAAEYGPDVERRFVASLAASVATTALSAGQYADAYRFAKRAVFADPRFIRGYLLLLVSLGGRPAYRVTRTGLDATRRMLESDG